MLRDELTELLRTGNEIVSAFSGLSPEKLNFRAEPKSWSIAQCLDHLIVSNRTYFPGFEKLSKPDYKIKFWEKYSPFTRTTGKQMVETLGRVVTKKFTAPKIFQPGSRPLSAKVVADFAVHQEELIKILSALTEEQYNSAVVTSPVAPLITLNLKDAIRVIIVHEQRHFEQAKRVLAQLQ